MAVRGGRPGGGDPDASARVRPFCFKGCEGTGKAQVCRHNFYHVVKLVVKDADAGKVEALSRLRRGKVLVPAPAVVSDPRNGRRGRIPVVRAHPFEGSTNPFALVCLRSNCDGQAMDRVSSLAPEAEAGLRRDLGRWPRRRPP